MVTTAPYLATVAITKSGTTKNFNPFTATYDYNLIEGRISQSYGGLISRLTLVIEDSDGTNYSFFTPGGTYSIQWGKTAGSLSTLTKGFVETRQVVRPDKNTMYYVVTCLDRNTLLERRVVNVRRFQKRTSAGALDSSDTSTDLGNLAKFVLGYDTDGSTANSDAYYPMNTFGNVKTIASEYSISASGIQTANRVLPEFTAQYQTAAATLQQLAEHKGWIAYIDENDVLQFKAPTATDSGILITDTESPSWDTTKVAHIIDDQPFTIEEDLTDTKNLLIGVGGDMDSASYTQTTTSGGSDVLHNTYLAVKLPRIKDVGLTAVGVWVNKSSGTPPDINLFGEIRQDNSNTPQGGAFVKGFHIDKSHIVSTAGGDWAMADLQCDINTQVDHWLILYKDLSGAGSASKTYKWFHDGGSSGTIATSSDGSTWSVTSSTKQYAYLIWTDARVFSVAQDASSISSYGQRDYVLSDTTIKTRASMENRLKELLSYTKHMKTIVTATVFPPDTIIPVGKTITVQESKSGLNNTFKVVQADYLINSVGALSMEVVASKVN